MLTLMYAQAFNRPDTRVLKRESLHPNSHVQWNLEAQNVKPLAGQDLDDQG